MKKRVRHPGQILREDYLEPRGITVTEAAKRLGITRQALNNFVNGKSALSAEMEARVADLIGKNRDIVREWQRDYELSTESGGALFVASSDLTDWAETIDARYTLPRVIRMLIRATGDPAVSVDFPSAEDSQMPGWDGLVDSPNGTGYIPFGRSGWELSTEAKPQEKAERDYRKRTQNPLVTQPSQTTYVALSMRRWPKKRQWASEKCNEAVWANVVAYDVSDLEQWLELAPDVGAWLAARIGHRPYGLQTLEDFWHEFRLSTSPPMTPEIILAGRHDQATRVLEWIKSGSEVMKVLADSSDEALAFLAAAIASQPDSEQTEALARTILTDNAVQIRQLKASKSRITFGWRLDDPSLLGSTIEQGHRVFVPLGRNAFSAQNADLELPRLARGEFIAAIKNSLPGANGSTLESFRDRVHEDPEAAKREARATEMARKAGCSLTVYRRLFAAAGVPRTPAWAQSDKAPELLPILLAGSWDELNEADKDIVAKLAGTNYEAVDRTLIHWSSECDSPIRRIGGSWYILSPLDAWSLLSRFLTDSYLARYREAILRVLGEPDPRLEIDPDKRWLAGPRGFRFKYSDTLRKGLSDSLILLSVIGNEAPWNASQPAQPFTASIVFDLLGSASGNTWASVADVLQALAEASPETFLTALENSLTQQPPGVLSLFEAEDLPLGGGGRLPRLLWSLEILAWYPEHLRCVATILAKLARLAPPIKILNRPEKSLREIFCTWHRNTAASLEARLAVIDRLTGSQPEATWNLLLELLPKQHDTSACNAEPRWRVKPEAAEITYGEIWSANGATTERALKLASTDWKRLIQLVSVCEPWLPEHRNTLIQQIQLCCTNSEELTVRTELWRRVREFVSLQRSFPDAGWSLNEPDLAGWVELLSVLTPEDFWEKYAWLFKEDCPNLENAHPVPFDERAQEVEKERLTVTRELCRNYGMDGVLTLAKRVEEPWFLGRALADLVNDEVEMDLLDRTFCAESSNLRRMGLAYVFRRYEKCGPNWSAGILATDMFRNWQPFTQSFFCVGLPDGRSTWSIVSSLGKEVEEAYWKQIHVFLVRLDQMQDAEYAIEMLLAANRALEALEQSGSHPEKLCSDTLIRVLREASAAVVNQGRHGDSTMREYYIERILGHLRASKSKDVTTTVVADLEWMYLGFIGMNRNPVTLHERLRVDPVFFSSIVAVAFKPDNDDDEEPAPPVDASPESRHQQALFAWRLLDSWNTPPGRRDDGTLNAEELTSWVTNARLECSLRKRSTIGDIHIGRVLARTPDTDGTWPPLVIRDLIEDCESAHLDSGFISGTLAKRGTWTKSPFDGGRQERELAKRYRDWSKSVVDRWDRTAKLLRSISDHYDSFAKREDTSAERLELLGNL